MADPANPNSPRASDDAADRESMLDLLTRARAGDAEAMENLLARVRPVLTRWAHGRLPPATRGMLDTHDLVQGAIVTALGKLGHFEPRHVGALNVYLRQAVINRIRDEVRKVQRRSAPAELPDAPLDESPLEAWIQTEAYQRYEQALAQLRERDRDLIVKRIELQLGYEEIAVSSGLGTVTAARMSVARALTRLAEAMRAAKPSESPS